MMLLNCAIDATKCQNQPPLGGAHNVDGTDCKPSTGEDAAASIRPKKPIRDKSGSRLIREFEEEFLKHYPWEEYAGRWIRNDSDWAQAASALVGAFHDREVARTQLTAQKSNLMLTSSFVALGVVGWVIVNFLGATLPISIVSMSIWQYGVLQLACVTLACLSATFLLFSIWWALHALGPISYSDINLKDALKLSRDVADDSQSGSEGAIRPGDLREFSARRIYLDWECSYVRNHLNQIIFSSYSRAWHRFMIGIALLSITWFVGLASRM